MQRAALLVVGVALSASFAACSGSGDDASPSTTSGTSVASSSGTGGQGGAGSSTGPVGSGGAGGGGGSGGHGDEHASTSGGGDAGTGGTGGQGGGCQNLLPTVTTAPPTLAETGLYADFATKAIAPHAREYEPQFPLWSDDAAKRRFVYLTECGNVDTSSMDDWQLPVGTRAWKEFSIGGKRIETRFMHRYGPSTKDILYATYLWNEAETSATLLLDGAKNVLGTGHDVPDEVGCKRCHGPSPTKGGQPSRFLGFGAVQLSHDGAGVTLSTLIQEGRLTHPPAGNVTVPGDPVARAALGYLHSNCGTCHNDSPDGLLFPAFDARLRAADLTVEGTGVYTTMVNQPTTLFVNQGCAYRIAGGNTADSCSVYRMSERGTDGMPNPKQMPPLGSEVVDAAGVGALEAWIATLPPPN
jgi:hypothetical protein